MNNSTKIYNIDGDHLSGLLNFLQDISKWITTGHILQISVSIETDTGYWEGREHKSKCTICEIK